MFPSIFPSLVIISVKIIDSISFRMLVVTPVKVIDSISFRVLVVTPVKVIDSIPLHMLVVIPVKVIDSISFNPQWSRHLCALDFRVSIHWLVLNLQSLNFLLLFFGKGKREKNP